MQKNGHQSSSIFAQYGPKLVGPVPGPKARAIVTTTTGTLHLP